MTGFRNLVSFGLLINLGRRSDQERAAELNAAIRDRNVNAIFPCAGGYGVTGSLDRIDYAALRQRPEILQGRSRGPAMNPRGCQPGG